MPPGPTVNDRVERVTPQAQQHPAHEEPLVLGRGAADQLGVLVPGPEPAYLVPGTIRVGAPAGRQSSVHGRGDDIADQKARAPQRLQDVRRRQAEDARGLGKTQGGCGRRRQAREEAMTCREEPELLVSDNRESFRTLR